MNAKELAREAGRVARVSGSNASQLGRKRVGRADQPAGCVLDGAASAGLGIARNDGLKLGYRPVPDLDFAKDVEEGIAARSQPLNPPSWD